MQQIINVILPIFGIIFIGWLSVHYKILIKKNIRPLNAFVYHLALPALIFMSLYKLDSAIFSNYKLLAVNILAPLTVLIIMLIIISFLKLSKSTKAGFLVCSFFGNVAYIGYPVNQAAFGEQGLSYAVIVSAIYLIFGLTIGDFIFQYYKLKKTNPLRLIENLFKTPIMWALISGIIISFVKVNVPTAITTLINMLAVCAGPVALFTIGMFIYGNPLKGKVIKEGIILSIIKMLILPLIVFGFAKLFGFTGLAADVSIMQAAMPIAVTTFVFAERFKLSEELVGDALIISTVLSIVPISVLLFIL